MKKILSIILTLTLSATVFAQPLPKKLEHNEKMAWWRNAKFGMFVHWGPYCLYGGVYNGFNQRRGGAEWIMNRCKIPVREYRAKACTFNPVDFNAEELVLTAKNAGMNEHIPKPIDLNNFIRTLKRWIDFSEKNK